MNRRQTGARYEAMAAEVLEKAGYRIISRNFRCRSGEIDLIARHRGYLVFIEVKYRRDGRAGHPEEAVDERKRARIIRTAGFYLYRYGYRTDTACRFDVVSIEGEKVRILENAFWA